MHDIEWILIIINNIKCIWMKPSFFFWSMNETIIVFSIIDKLHLSWKNFKRSMQHKKFVLINWRVIFESKNIYLKWACSRFPKFFGWEFAIFDTVLLIEDDFPIDQKKCPPFFTFHISFEVFPWRRELINGRRDNYGFIHIHFMLFIINKHSFYFMHLFH